MCGYAITFIIRHCRPRTVVLTERNWHWAAQNRQTLSWRYVSGTVDDSRLASFLRGKFFTRMFCSAEKRAFSSEKARFVTREKLTQFSALNQSDNWIQVPESRCRALFTQRETNLWSACLRQCELSWLVAFFSNCFFFSSTDFGFFSLRIRWCLL